MATLSERKKRIAFSVRKLEQAYYPDKAPLRVLYANTSTETVARERVDTLDFIPITIGQKWGSLWDRGWFILSGSVPDHWQGRQVVALIDIEAEGCVYIGDEPLCGLTHKSGKTLFHRKRRVPLFEIAQGCEPVNIMVQTAGNEMFGPWGSKEFYLHQAELALFDPAIWKLYLDMKFLFDLYETLDPKTVRAKRILKGLESASVQWISYKDVQGALDLTGRLLSEPASSSALTAWSVGHAHLDLAWLWPIEETHNKAVRTFSTALALMEEYPDYVFGASQPQLYQWIKDEHPGLYERIKKAVNSGSWELQGGMWVESDINLAGAEALVRQCLYGIRFFEQEFGQRVKNLWLPDVFGYSGALPQILKKCGISTFTTMKISWNDTNPFPHHTFWWEGIDGSRVLSHFLPAGEYHLNNSPRRLIESQDSFIESDEIDDFLSLYGIGDGGGGPSREHIEFALRAADCEGLPRVRLAKAQDCFERLEAQSDNLATWKGELYLELHRGTYTTQARTKALNQRIEMLLQQYEYLLCATTSFSDHLEVWWKTLLLHQFHDILPGSSITQVYEEAEAVLGGLEQDLLIATRSQIAQTVGLRTASDVDATHLCAMNTLQWERLMTVDIPWVECTHVKTLDGDLYPVYSVDDRRYADLPVPAFSVCTIFPLGQDPSIEEQESLIELSDSWEVSLPSGNIRLLSDGSIGSIIDSQGFEYSKEACKRWVMYDDIPHQWDAWDIAEYVYESRKESALLQSRRVVHHSHEKLIIEQVYLIGSSSITEFVTFRAHELLVEITATIDWREDNKLLKLENEHSLQSQQATCEIQWGVVKRSTLQNTSWDTAQFEIPAHRFVDVSTPDRGIALMTSGKYGYRAKGSSLELSVLRAPSDPDPLADRGTQELKAALYVHEGDYEHSELLKKAHCLAQPETWTYAAGNPTSSDLELVRQIPQGIKLESVKPAEDGKGIILRLYEFRGSRTTGTIVLSDKDAMLQECSMLEEAIEGAEPMHGLWEGGFDPFEIKTFLLIPRG